MERIVYIRGKFKGANKEMKMSCTQNLGHKIGGAVFL